MERIVLKETAARPVGPYSQAIKAGGFIFIAGQIPLDPQTQKLVDGGIGPQTERVLRNISEILRAAGCDIARLVRCVVYLRDMNDFAQMNASYEKFFQRQPPVRTTVGVSRLPRDCLIEIEGTAVD